MLRKEKFFSCPVTPADGPGVAPADGTGACPVASADGTGVVQKTKTKRAISTPSPFLLVPLFATELCTFCTNVPHHC